MSELTFRTKLKFKDELATSEKPDERKAFVAWGEQLQGTVWYLLGVTKDRFYFADAEGEKAFEFVGADPSYLFKTA